MFEIVNESVDREGARVKVIGVGGAGGNAVQTMISSQLSGVDFVAANTDLQALEKNKADIKIQLGGKLTRGLGAGANPDVGRQAAIESCEALAKELTDVDMVFITAGMGGGTGTGAASVIADVARQQGALTVGVVTRPFSFEGKRRKLYADMGITALKEKVDTLIVIPNDKLLTVSGQQTPILDTFRKADDVLLQAVRGISDLINVHGLINLDFADVRTVMFEKGEAIMGIGTAEGENRVVSAAEKAISSPLLDNTSIKGATSVIINVTGDSNLSLLEVNEASTFITRQVHPSAEIIFGAVIDNKNIGNKARVTVIAAGFDKNSTEEPQPKKIQEESLVSESQPANRTMEPSSSAVQSKILPRDRLIQKSKMYRESQNIPHLEMEEKKKDSQLSMDLSADKSIEREKKKTESPFGQKGFFKKSLSFFLDD